MSKSKHIGADEKIKFSDVQGGDDDEGEEKKAKAKEMSKEGTHNDTEGSDEKKTRGEEKTDIQQQEGRRSPSSTPAEGSGDNTTAGSPLEKDVGLPFKKRLDCRRVTVTYHGTNADDRGVNPKFKSGVQCKDQQGRGASNNNDQLIISFDDHDDEEERLLFDLVLTSSNRLLIPAELAEDYFPPLLGLGGTQPEETIRLIDTKLRASEISISYYADEDAFMVTKGWKEFSNRYDLKATDTICFFRPDLRRGRRRCFLIECVKGLDGLGDELLGADVVVPENLLFELELTGDDVGYGRLAIPKEEVASHFPGVEVHREERPERKRNEIIRFSESRRDKDWYMNVVYSADLGACLIVDGWEGFVREHRLEAGDVIKFYKPFNPLHSKHFLIDSVKKRRAPVADDHTTNNRTLQSKNEGRGGSYKGKEKLLFW